MSVSLSEVYFLDVIIFESVAVSPVSSFSLRAFVMNRDGEDLRLLFYSDFMDFFEGVNLKIT